MKVLQVIDTLNAGGAERVLIDISNLLAQNKGTKVTVLTITTDGTLAVDLHRDITRINLNRKFKFSPLTAWRFVSILNRFDIVHIHMRHVLKYYWFSTRLTQCHAKVFFHDHFGDIELNKSVPFHLKALKDQLTYIGVSRQLCDWAVNTVGFNSARVHFLANIVMDVEIKKKEKTSDHKMKRIIVVSNYKRTKNIEFALKLASALKQELSFSMDIYGGSQDEQYMTELQSLRKKLDLENCVTLHVDELNIRKKFFEYDLAVHCALSETGPLVLIEYLAARLPFLSFETGEVAFQLKPHLPLFFLDDFRIERWKERIISFFKQTDQLNYATFDHLFNTHFSKETYWDRLLKIYSGSPSRHVTA